CSVALKFKSQRGDGWILPSAVCGQRQVLTDYNLFNLIEMDQHAIIDDTIMAPKIDFIDEINPFKKTWKIEGGKIQATMKKSLINKFNCQLKEESNENLELDESIKHGEQITDVDTSS
ncbi:hypothetical protein Taro_030277, partial [Colocasia esculenta]|nr:hypothetical protein [Colocasia esculenta]